MCHADKVRLRMKRELLNPSAALWRASLLAGQGWPPVAPPPAGWLSWITVRNPSLSLYHSPCCVWLLNHICRFIKAAAAVLSWAQHEQTHVLQLPVWTTSSLSKQKEKIQQSENHKNYLILDVLYMNQYIHPPAEEGFMTRTQIFTAKASNSSGQCPVLFSLREHLKVSPSASVRTSESFTFCFS